MHSDFRIINAELEDEERRMKRPHELRDEAAQMSEARTESQSVGVGLSTETPALAATNFASGGSRVPNQQQTPQMQGMAETVEIQPTILPKERSISEWSELIRGGLEKAESLGVEPCTYGVRSALFIAEKEIFAMSDSNGRTAVVTPEHFLLGILTLGLVYQSGTYGRDSLADHLSQSITPTPADLTKIRVSILSGTEFHTQAEEVPDHSSVNTVLVEAAAYQERCTPTDDYLALRHLLAALIQWSVTSAGRRFRINNGISLQSLLDGLNRDVERMALGESGDPDENLQAWSEIQLGFIALVRDEEIGISTPVSMREAGSEQLCLNVKNLAIAVAKTIDQAPEGDFCMAIKGQWGRGKTTLIRRVVNELDPSLFPLPSTKPSDDPSQNKKQEPKRSAKSRDSKFRAVIFNVWKYPNRPQVWVHLYQEIQRVASEGGLLHQARLVFHQSLHAVGWLPLFTAHLLLLVSILPILEGAFFVAETLGVASLIFLVFFFKNAGNFARNVRLRYFTPVDHSTHLGLQATIGDDLRNLLKAWIILPGQPAPSKTAAAGLSCLMVLIASAACYRLNVAKPVEGSRLEALWNNDALQYWLWVSLVPIGLLWMLMPPPKGPEKVLLVADDLDRCPSDSMIGIIESLRLLLEDPEIHHRMRTVILFDESLLIDALEAKYYEKLNRTKREEDTATLNTKVQRLVRGQLEKYFLLELHLPPMTKKETRDYFNSLVNADANGGTRIVSADQSKSSAAPDTRLTQFDGSNEEIAKTPTTIVQSQDPAPTEPMVSALSSKNAETPRDKESSTKLAHEFRFLKSEVGLVQTLLDDLSPGTASPRTVRSFLMRCQLAMFILNHPKRDFDSHKLIRAVAFFYYGIGEQPTDGIETEVASHVI